MTDTAGAMPAAALLQLIWLASPALPIGGFSYSEGFEAGVEWGGIDSEVQLDLRNSENESDKFDSGGRYVDSFASGLDSVAVGVNRVTVKSNRGRVWALGNMPRRGGER
jgi:hypothetical protein